MMKDLVVWSSPIDQYAGHAIGEALKIVKTYDPTWVSDWLATKLLDGSLYGEHWQPFLLPISQEKGNDLVRALATREFSYSEASATHMILSIGAAPELAQQIFDQLCNLQRTISAGGAQPLISKCVYQLREVFRSFSIDIAVTGMMRSLQGAFDRDKFQVVTDVLGRVNPDAGELRSTLPAALRNSLRLYLKDGIAKVLADDLFDDGIRSHAAISLGRVGDPEDLADLERLIDADIKRANGKLGGTNYSNWYRYAVEWLDAPDGDTILIALLRTDRYMLEAARGLFELAVPLRRGITTDYETIWTARGGMRPHGFDAERAKRYAEAIKERIAELKQEATASAPARYLSGRAKELAVLLAALDGHDSANVVIEALSLPGEWDAYLRMNGIRALLMSGGTLKLSQMLVVLDPAIDHAFSEGLYRDESLSLLFRCLELLPFGDDPAGAIAHIEQVMTKFKYRPYQFRDLVTAMGHTRAEVAVSFLVNVARGGVGLQNITDAWIKSLGRLNTESARRALLSFVDPDIPSIGVSISFDYHNTEIYAAFVGGWGRQDFTLRYRLLTLSQGNLSAAQQRLLRAIYHELGDEDAMIAGVNLLQGSLSPWSSDRGIEVQFLERQPSGHSSGSFVLVPRNAERARAELFQKVLNDADRSKAAFAILGQVEVWRLEYGRPLGEPRHPMIETGKPWPPLAFFPKAGGICGGFDR